MDRPGKHQPSQPVEVIGHRGALVDRLDSVLTPELSEGSFITMLFGTMLCVQRVEASV